MRTFLKKIALLCSAAVAVLLIVELALRLSMPVYPVGDLRSFQYDDELGFVPKPALHEFETTDHQEEMISNALGSANFQSDFSDYQHLVFAIGDSFTQGTGLPADMSYPAQLDLLVNRDPHGMYKKRFGIVNLGIAGIGGEQELIVLDRWSKKIGPAAVVLYLGYDNDHDDDLLFRNGYFHRHLVDGSPAWGPLVRPMQWLTSDLQIGLRTKLLIADMRHRAITSSSSTDPSVSVAELEQPVLEKLLGYARRDNARLVVSWSTEGDSYEWLKTWAAHNAIQFADWAPRVDSVKRAIPELPLENQHSGGHHRGWVNAIIAQEYAAAIEADFPTR